MTYMFKKKMKYEPMPTKIKINKASTIVTIKVKAYEE